MDVGAIDARNRPLAVPAGSRSRCRLWAAKHIQRARARARRTASSSWRPSSSIVMRGTSRIVPQWSSG